MIFLLSDTIYELASGGLLFLATKTRIEEKIENVRKEVKEDEIYMHSPFHPSSSSLSSIFSLYLTL